jgi:Holliday junction resolvase
MKTEGQKQSQKHEKRLAKTLGGKKTAASGAFWSMKGDVRMDDFLIEHKWTGKKTFTLKADVLEKIITEAILDGRTPALGVHLNGKNYVLLEEYDFVELRNYRIEHECDTMTTPNGPGDTKLSAEE